MVQEGAQDYLVESSCSSALLKTALQYAVVRRGKHAGKEGSIVSADRAKLKRQTGNRTLLVAGFYQWILPDRVDELFLVTSTSIPALYESKRIIGALQKVGFEADRLRLIVNQFGDRSDYSGSELDRIFGSEFRGHIVRLARKVSQIFSLAVRFRKSDRHDSSRPVA